MQAKIQLYDLLAKLNTYDHIERIFVLNKMVDRPADVPNDELYNNQDDTKKQYYMFNQMTGTNDFFNKVLNIDQNYKLNQAKTSDIVYITYQNNRELENLRLMYAQILNPNVITIKLNTSGYNLTKTGIQAVMDFLSLSGKPHSINIANDTLPSNIQKKVVSYVAKYQPRNTVTNRNIVIYPAEYKYQDHDRTPSIFDMYITDPAIDFMVRVVNPDYITPKESIKLITSVTSSSIARFLAKLLTTKSLAHKPGKSRKSRLASGVRRFTRKVLGRVSSRRKQALELNRELPSRRSSKRAIYSTATPPSKANVPLGNNAAVNAQLEYAAKYLSEIARLDTLIMESGKSRQQKQKTTAQRSIIENIHRRYREHRIAYIRAIKNLFSHGPGNAKSRLHAIFRQAERPKTKQLIERIIRILDDKDRISNMQNTNIDTKTLKREYANTIRQNIAANPGFFKKLTRKRILSQLSTVG